MDFCSVKPISCCKSILLGLIASSGLVFMGDAMSASQLQGFSCIENHRIHHQVTTDTATSGAECRLAVKHELAQPLPDFELIQHAARMVISPAQAAPIATVNEYVWRNAKLNECIIGSKIILLVKRNRTSTHIQQLARTQLSPGGHQAAYSLSSRHQKPVTSIQLFDSSKPSATSPVSVGFNVDVRIPTHPTSPMLYIRGGCSASALAEHENVIELTLRNPDEQIVVPGFLLDPQPMLNIAE
jgi:hypothetical protein